MKKYPALLFGIIVLFSGCNYSSRKEFSFTFIMETANAYKLTFQIDHTKRYSITEQYIIFENSPHYKSPLEKNGAMSNEEFDLFNKLLTGSNLAGLEQSYGFGRDTDHPLNDVVYHIIYTTGGKPKFISIKLNDFVKYPHSFVQLIEYVNKFINGARRRTG